TGKPPGPPADSALFRSGCSREDPDPLERVREAVTVHPLRNERQPRSGVRLDRPGVGPYGRESIHNLLDYILWRSACPITSRPPSVSSPTLGRAPATSLSAPGCAARSRPCALPPPAARPWRPIAPPCRFSTAPPPRA